MEKFQGFAGHGGFCLFSTDDEQGTVHQGSQGGGIIGGKNRAGIDDDMIELGSEVGEELGCGVAQEKIAGIQALGAAPDEGEVGQTGGLNDTVGDDLFCQELGEAGVGLGLDECMEFAFSEVGINQEDTRTAQGHGGG